MKHMLILATLLATQAVGVARTAAAEDVVDISRGRPWLPPLAPLTAEQQKTLDAFNKAFRVPDVKPNGKGVTPEDLAALRKRVREEYGIHWEGTELRGQPIAFFQGSGNKATLPASLYLPDVVATINRVVAAYGKASPGQENELKEMFLDLCRHILRAGLVEGAPPSTFSGGLLPIPSANYAWLNQSRGIISMRPVLADAGLLLPMMRAVSWWANPDWLDEMPRPNNSDLWRCGHWLDLDGSIAGMPDSPEKWQRLMAMVRFFSNNIVVGDALPPSGEFAHHWGFHLAYSYAMPFVLREAVSLHQAGLELSSAARERLRAYGRTVAWMLMNDVFTMNLSLRPAGLGRKAMAGELRLLADLGAPDHSGPIDREMAALYLACAKPDAKDEAAARYRAARIAPTVLAGAMAMPTRPGLVWRRPETLVAVAGMRPHFRGFEVYGWNHCRYPLNGSVMVLKAGGERPMPGFEPERGWDWSLWPGATSVIESDAMLQPRRGLGYGGNRNPVGGVCVLANSDSPECHYLRKGADAAGLFMVDFDAGNRTVTFRKSVFAVGGHVLVQTSGINSTRKEPSVTTLYQNHLDETNQVSVLDGEAMRGIAADLTIRVDQPHSLTDAVGMNYRVLPVPGRTVQPTLRVLRRHQIWRMCDDRYVKPECKEKAQQVKAGSHLPPELSSDEFLNFYQTLEGDFAVAYFDHGGAPKDAADVYVLTPDPPKDSKSELPIILTQTNTGHAAFDTATRTYAYASFEPEMKWESGPLVHTGRPAAVLVREMPDGFLKLTIASWDLKNTASFSLRLKGAWEVLALQTDRIAATIADHDTVLDIPYTGDMPRTLKLKRRAP